jgi:THO complex subunit 1
MMGIVDDDFDIDLAKDEEAKGDAERAKASKVWRTLRLASRTKLGQFDKIEDGKNIKMLFESPQPLEESKKVTSEAEQVTEDPEHHDAEEDASTNPGEENLESTAQEATQPQPSAETTVT